MMFQQNGGDPSAAANLKEHLKGKTMEELRGELDVIFEREATDGTPVDPAVPAAYYEAMAALEPQDAGADGAFEGAWARFRETHPDLFPREGGGKRTRERRRRLRVGRLLEAAVLAAALMVLSAAAFRWPEYIVTWGDEILRLTPADSGKLEMDEPNEAGYTSLQEAVDDIGIQDPCVPQWIPEDYSLLEIIVSGTNVSKSIAASYCDQADNEILMRISYYADKSDMPDLNIESDLNTEDMELYQRGDIQYQYSRNYGTSRLTWIDGQCISSITGPISKEEIEKMADSIYGGAV